LVVRAKGRTGQAGARRAPEEPAESARKRRADALRNRDRLIEAAKASFGAAGAGVSLEEIAQRAGVGIGTLYRHFPTRDAIVEAVYRREVEQLADAANRLTGSLPAGEALHAWMRLFVDYIATKRVIAPALKAMVDGASELRASSSARITEAMAQMVERAKSVGDIRADADPADLLRAIVGLTQFSSGDDWEASARRLIDILMDGLRSPPQA
jgi:AcrR family transcriptional regulator